MIEQITATLQQDSHVQLVRSVGRKGRLFLVGGAVRDAILGLPVRDYDFAVDGSGIRFGRTVARKIGGAYVLLSKADDEARVVKDGVVYDFVGLGDNDIERDLRRRDFTVNALGIDLDRWQWFDTGGGLSDIKKRIIRVTTENSLADDPLRVLRAFRFALELGFTISKEFYRYAPAVSLRPVAAERIGAEMMRIMACADSYAAIDRLNDLGFLKEVFVEAAKIIDDPELWSHSLRTYQAAERLLVGGFFRTEFEPEYAAYFSVARRIPLVKLAALFHDVAKPDTFLLKEGAVHFYGHDTKGSKIVETLMYRRLKLARSDVTTVRKLVKEHMRPHLLATNQEVTERALRRFFRNLGDDYFGSMIIAWADGYATAGKTRHLEQTFTRMIGLKRADDARPKIDRLVDGHDLIDLGLVPGPVFKIILQELLDRQLEGTIGSKAEGKKAALEIFKRLQEKGVDGNEKY